MRSVRSSHIPRDLWDSTSWDLIVEMAGWDNMADFGALYSKVPRLPPKDDPIQPNPRRYVIICDSEMLDS